MRGVFTLHSLVCFRSKSWKAIHSSALGQEWWERMSLESLIILVTVNQTTESVRVEILPWAASGQWVSESIRRVVWTLLTWRTVNRLEKRKTWGYDSPFENTWKSEDNNTSQHSHSTIGFQGSGLGHESWWQVPHQLSHLSDTDLRCLHLKREERSPEHGSISIKKAGSWDLCPGTLPGQHCPGWEVFLL